MSAEIKTGKRTVISFILDPVDQVSQESLRGSWLAYRTPRPKALPHSPQTVAARRILLYHEASRWIMMEEVMTTVIREKFSSQAAPDVLGALRQIAESQGRQFQAVIDEALRDYIDRQQKERPRRHVRASFASSLDEFNQLYSDLAK